MFFVLSKVIFALIAPSNLCVILMAGGFVLQRFRHWQRTGRRLMVGGFVLLLFFGFSPFGRWLSIPLEDRFASVALPDRGQVTHIIFLGGFEQAAIAEARGEMAMNAAGERLTQSLLLARQYPEAKVVFTGGYGRLVGTPVDAARSVSDYLAATGIARDRILAEGRSRNTFENALFVSDEIEKAGASCPCGFVLVTSAFHMARAVGVFRKAGFEGGDRRLHPAPVDFRTRGMADFWSPYAWAHEGLEQSDLAFKEWVGLLAYWMSGRMDVLWPGPGRRDGSRERVAKRGVRTLEVFYNNRQDMECPRGRLGCRRTSR